MYDPDKAINEQYEEIEQLKDEIKALEEFKDVVLKRYPSLFDVWLDCLRRKDNERRME